MFKGLYEAHLPVSSDNVHLAYHPSIRHLAFKIGEADFEHLKEWLQSIDIEIHTAFGFSPQQQPIVLPNNPHAAIYFADPDGNSIELITSLGLDVDEEFTMMSLEKWYKN